MLTQTANGNVVFGEETVMVRGQQSPLAKLRFNHLDRHMNFRFAFGLRLTEGGTDIEVYDLATLEHGVGQPPAMIGTIAIRGQFLKLGMTGVYDEWDGLVESITIVTLPKDQPV